MRDQWSAIEEIVPAQRASEHVLALVHRWWLVLGLAVLTACLAYAISSREHKRYDATAKVLLISADPVNLLLHSAAPPSTDPERDINTDVALVTLDTTAQSVREQLRLSQSASSLVREVNASPEGTSDVIDITAEDLSPTRAAAIANAFAAQYIATRRSLAQSAYTDAAHQARFQLAGLTESQSRGAQGAALRKQLQQLTTVGALQTGDAQLVGLATVPTTAASPRPTLAAAVGGFVGLLLGSLAAMALGAADRRQRALRRTSEARLAHGEEWPDHPSPATAPDPTPTEA
jgi:uncharacterized protein involved in exopolysaccharide biosynthesis